MKPKQNVLLMSSENFDKMVSVNWHLPVENCTTGKFLTSSWLRNKEISHKAGGATWARSGLALHNG